jgi:hypothetical protein
MKLLTLAIVVLVCVLGIDLAKAAGDSPAASPSAAYLHYLPDGRVELPKDYRDWAFLTSGVDMSYSAGGMGMTGHMFGNAFVDRDGLRAFKASGTWPDGTVIALETRNGQTKGSINKAGIFQAGPVQGMEIHVKDSVRFKGGWAFFAFGSNEPAQQIPTTAACYSCHQMHAAVDTTFVQFYPTLIGIAREKKTLSAGYLSDTKTER